VVVLSVTPFSRHLDLNSETVSRIDVPPVAPTGSATAERGDSVLHSALLPSTILTTRSNEAAGPLVRPSPTATPVPSDDQAIMEAAGLTQATAQPTPSPSPQPIFITYVVQDGDTVSGIASRFGISSTSVIWNNNLESVDSLSLGQQLHLPTSDGIVYEVQPGDTLSDIAAGFSVDVQAIIAFPANSLSDGNSLAVGQTIFIPGGIMPAPVATATGAPPESTPPPATVAATPAPVPLPVPDDNSSDLGSRAVALARSRTGSPYAPNGDGPNSFDCSGLVNWVYSQLGVDVPRSAADQYNWATPVSRDDMEPGDLVFFSGTTSSGGITHVGIYAGGNGVIMAVDNGDVVREVSLGEDYWNGHFAAAGRPR
jgi:cell wall-associated NlpC family hydrolase